jgi:hypothetical protein
VSADILNDRKQQQEESDGHSVTVHSVEGKEEDDRGEQLTSGVYDVEHDSLTMQEDNMLTEEER